MKLTRMLTTLSSIAVLGVALAGPVSASQDDHGFAMLKGVQATTLSAQDMQAIEGELNAYDIAAALLDEASKLSKYPRLQAAVTNLANQTLANATQINAFFAKFGVLTPCLSCTP